MNARPFAYTPGSNVPGTDKVGDISYGHPTSGFEGSEFEWWNGPDEELGYIIAKSISNDSQPTPVSGVTASVGFNRSEFKTEASFIELVNNVFNETFIDGNSAKSWLTANGHWTSYGLDINFVTGIQTYSILYNMEDETSQWGIINLDHTNNTLTLNPLGLSSNEWNHDGSYPLNESGYMRAFASNNTGEIKVLFLDAASNVIQTINVSGNINYDVLHGKIAFVKYDGVIWYFDGLNVYQYTHPTENLNYTEVLWNNDATSSNGTFMYKVAFNDGFTVIEMLHAGTALTVAEYNNLIENYEIKLYDQADYYVISKLSLSNVYEKFEIRKISDNSLLHLVDLTGFFKADESVMEYKHFNFNNYGINKFIMVMHNWDDLDVDYKIYTYNGTTNVLNSTSHVKGVNYPNFNMIANSNSGMSDIGRDSALVSFSSNSGWNGSMNTYAYFDIVYQMSWQTNLNEYVFTNNGIENETGISFGYDGFTNNYYTICTTNNIDLQVLSITEADGLNITTIGLLTDFHNPYLRSFGNKTCLVAYTANDGTGMILKYFGNTATVKDSLTIIGTSQWSIQTFNAWNIFGIKHENILYHINTTTDTIVTIGPWEGDNDFTASSYYEADSLQRKTNTTLLFNSFTYEAIILKPTTYVTGTLPVNSNNYNIRMGKNSFMYIFEDPNSGNMQINLYDFNLTLLNSILTDKTNFSFSSRGVKDRFMTRHNNGDGTYTWFMITPTFSNSVMTSTSNTSRIENDWIYWN